MSPLYRPFIVPRFGRVTEFLRPYFRITSGLPSSGTVTAGLAARITDSRIL